MVTNSGTADEFAFDQLGHFVDEEEAAAVEELALNELQIMGAEFFQPQQNGGNCQFFCANFCANFSANF